MKWRWFPSKRIGNLVSPKQDALDGPNLAVLTAIADGFRDDRNWPQAVLAYERVVREFPLSMPIWVQFGHAQKEAGNISGAEAAYRQALALDPDNADCLVQLGHALKLQGQRDAAIAAYAGALRVDRTCDPALRELLALGEGATAGQISGIGLHGLHDVLAMMDQMRRSLLGLERMLPDIASLASVAVGHYDLFRQNYRLPVPPVPVAKRAWAAIVIAGDSDCVPALRSLAVQTMVPAQVFIHGAAASVLGRAEQSGYYGLGLNVLTLEPGMARSLVSRGCDWVLVVGGNVVLAETAVAWLDWATENCLADVIYADEAWSGDGAAGPVPNFKASYDRDAGRSLFEHAVLAVRASAIADIVGNEAPAVIDAVIEAVVEAGGGVAHLARVLGLRSGMPGLLDETRAIPEMGGMPGRICAIIPTRDGRDMLEKCIAALREHARRPDHLDIVIIDNGSVEPAMIEFLGQLATTAWTRILRIDAKFNWSRLNNAGAAASAAEILLFINDDVEVSSAGWDDILRARLAMPHVGAVGARLDYPDGGLQHAGIVFGPGGRCEHEGVGTLRVPPQIVARWTTRRQVGAVTGAFLACRHDVFDRLGAFDPGLPIWFNDVDFCLRLRQRGFRIIFEPALNGIHRESPTLSIGAADPDRQAIWDTSLAEVRRRWGDALGVDPGFNPHFSRSGRPFEAIFEPSLTAVLAHLQRSALPNPWLIP